MYTDERKFIAEMTRAVLENGLSGVRLPDHDEPYEITLPSGQHAVITPELRRSVWQLSAHTDMLKHVPRACWQKIQKHSDTSPDQPGHRLREWVNRTFGAKYKLDSNLHWTLIVGIQEQLNELFNPQGIFAKLIPIDPTVDHPGRLQTVKLHFYMCSLGEGGVPVFRTAESPHSAIRKAIKQLDHQLAHWHRDEAADAAFRERVGNAFYTHVHALQQQDTPPMPIRR